jgi:hypothetical protein
VGPSRSCAGEFIERNGRAGPPTARIGALAERR